MAFQYYYHWCGTKELKPDCASPQTAPNGIKMKAPDLLETCDSGTYLICAPQFKSLQQKGCPFFVCQLII